MQVNDLVKHLLATLRFLFSEYLCIYKVNYTFAKKKN